MSEPKPLPCPFCGAKNVDVIQGSTFRWLIAECQECGARAGEVRVQTFGEGSKKDWQEEGERDAIIEWNKRTTHQISDEVLRQVRQIISDAQSLIVIPSVGVYLSTALSLLPEPRDE